MDLICQTLSLPVPESKAFSLQAIEKINPELGHFYRTFMCASLPRTDDYDRVRICSFKLGHRSHIFGLDEKYTTGVDAIAISLPPQFEPELGSLALQMPRVDYPFSQSCHGIHRRLYWSPSEDALKKGCFEFAIPFAWVEDTHFPDEIRRHTVLGDGKFSLYLLFWQPVILFAGDSVVTGGFWMSDVERENAMYVQHTSCNFNPWRHLPFTAEEIDEKVSLYLEDPMKWEYSFDGAHGQLGYVARMPDALGFEEAAMALAEGVPAEDDSFALI